eukprot:669665-Prorocentrum_minimum.AAC.1
MSPVCPSQLPEIPSEDGCYRVEDRCGGLGWGLPRLLRVARCVRGICPYDCARGTVIRPIASPEGEGQYMDTVA